MDIEGNPNSLTYRIEHALLTRHPVTLPPERARNYAELAASILDDEKCPHCGERLRLG